MKERTQLLLKLIFSHVILVPFLICTSIFINEDSFLLLTIAQTVLLILFLAGYWEFLGIRFKYAYCLLSEIAIIFILVKEIGKIPEEVNIYLVIPLFLLQIFLLAELAKIIMVIFKEERDSFEITFPFKNGKYLITDGGNSASSRLMNYHFYSRVHKKNKTNQSMLFATDIIKFTNYKSNLLPPRNEDYPIFGEIVYSPVSGKVFRIVNDIDDNIPYSGSYPYNTGNTIVIQNDDRYMLMGHLKKGSIIVSVGEHLNAGDIIAEAGNSGYSERPHIHLQLIASPSDNYWNGSGINIMFRNKNLYKNRIIEI